MPGELTHLDEAGNPRMVDVGRKPDTDRRAVAEGRVRFSSPETLGHLTNPKGDVLAVARLAGIQGAKQAASLIPLCHPLPIDAVSVEIEAEGAGVRIRAEVGTRWRTGVEMEALTAVTAAALTVYDMLKAVDRAMQIEGVRLLEKRGGRSGDWSAPDQPIPATPRE